MEPSNRNQQLLLTAGPVPISLAVEKSLSQPMTYHRSEEFVNIFKRLIENMKYLLQTRQEILILTASGTGGMEAVITNSFSPGDTVLVAENGKFSERWSQLAESFGLNVIKIIVPWGKSVTADELSMSLQNNPSVKAVFLTQCETSTGALTDLEAIVPQIRNLTPALVIVDAMSSAGVIPLYMDKWGIDIVVTASQKGLGSPPGLAFVALNKRVWRNIEQAELPRYYFDFARARQALRLNRGSAYTPAIPVVFAVDTVLTEIRQVGLERIWQQRKDIATLFRENIIAEGLNIFPDQPADGMTVIKIDVPGQANQVISLLKDKYQIVVSKGQGQLTDKVIRVGHFRNIENQQLNYFLESLKAVLSNLNQEVKHGQR